MAEMELKKKLEWVEKEKRDNLLKQIDVLVEKFCDGIDDCSKCPFHEFASCPLVQTRAVLGDMPTYEELPIDLDDEYCCDECCKPVINGCIKDDERTDTFDDCPYNIGECCEDNLVTNVGRICFDHNVPTNVSMAIIEILQKERERNEYLRIFGEHF